MKKLVLASIAGLMATATPASAAVESLVGDEDCFGLGGSCPEGSLWRADLGASFFDDNRDPGDPFGTDQWDTFVVPTYTHDFDLGSATPVSASLEMLISGIASTGSDVDIDINGTVIDSIPDQGSLFESTTLFSFSIPTSLISSGLNSLVVTILTDGSDGYAVDYSRITVETGMSAVPVPAAAPLMLAGLAAFGARARKKKS
ncbi:MAG: VPLPA-CTERM sorting domain-containing protein [Pseudomonadota bacterium]